MSKKHVAALMDERRRRLARLATVACSRPWDGQGRWTLDLLAERMVRMNVVPAELRDTVWWAMKGT